MFPFFGLNCCSDDICSPKAFQERRLKFLKWMRDDLEARLAGLNAAIETIERQISREDVS